MRPESVRMAWRFWGALDGAVPKDRTSIKSLTFSLSLSHADLWNLLPRTEQLRAVVWGRALLLADSSHPLLGKKQKSLAGQAAP